MYSITLLVYSFLAYLVHIHSVLEYIQMVTVFEKTP